MTKEEILNAIRVCARKLKRNPNMNELRVMAGISERAIYTRIGNLGKALESAGLQVSGSGFAQTEERLLLDWAMAARKLKKVPSLMEYQRAGSFTGTPFHKRYGSWTRVPRAFQRFARKRKLEPQWRDVLRMIADGRVQAANGTQAAKDAQGVFQEKRYQRNTLEKGTLLKNALRGNALRGNAQRTMQRNARNTSAVNGRRRTGRRDLLPGRPVYGEPLGLPELAYAPTNEMGVMFLFALMARRLGFVVQRLQPAYPDCEAMRQTKHGQCQRVWIEFEYESRNFLKHRHRRDRCDVIVCWRHNWKDAPANLEIIELCRLIG